MKKIFFVSFAVILLYAPLVSAQDGLVRGLVPCGEPGNPCTICHLFQLLNNLINFITLRFTPIVAALLFVVAGLQIILSAGNPAKFKAALNLFRNTIIGVAIIYLAWLAVNTILQVLAGGSNIADSWYKIECSGTSIPSGSTTTGTAGPPVSGTKPEEGGFGGFEGGEFGGGGAGRTFGYSEEAAREVLKQNGITVNKQPCPDGVRFQDVPGGCTSLEGVRQEAIDGAIDLKKKCNCNVVVTGGTELGHGTGEFSHANGYKLDYARNPQLDSYIESNFQLVGTRRDGAQLYKNPQTGAVYAKEGTHWDVKGWEADYEG